MAWVDDDDEDLDRPNAYNELLAREEKNYTRRGGRLVLLGGDQIARQLQPTPLLADLRTGQPVVVEDWRVPPWARPGGGRVRNIRLRVHPNGKVEVAQ